MSRVLGVVPLCILTLGILGTSVICAVRQTFENVY
jgi:hypothetical protein